MNSTLVLRYINILLPQYDPLNIKMQMLLFQVSYLIVDESDDDMEMEEDPFLKIGLPNNLPTDGKCKKNKQKTKIEMMSGVQRVNVKEYNVNIQCASKAKGNNVA